MPLATTVRAGGTGGPSTGRSRAVAPWSITSPRASAGEARIPPRSVGGGGEEAGPHRAARAVAAQHHAGGAVAERVAGRRLQVAPLGRPPVAQAVGVAGRARVIAVADGQGRGALA